MQNAPSVAYPVGRFSWSARFALIGLALMGLAGVLGAALVWPTERGPWLVFPLSGAWATWSWIAWRREAASTNGTLRWDATAVAGGFAPQAGSWWWQAQGHALAEPLVALERRLDWGSGMLVRGQTRGQTHWFWLSAALAEGRWGELRRAIEAQAKPR